MDTAEIRDTALNNGSARERKMKPFYVSYEAPELSSLC